MADDKRALVLEVENLRVAFDAQDGPIEAVRGIALRVRAGETVAIVGESGSGKSQAMMAVMGLLAKNGRAQGSARLNGFELIGAPARALDARRGAMMTMIFQEPMTSLDPLFRIGAQMAEPLRAHGGLSAKAARARAIALLRQVEIPEPERRIDAYPHELSGGQRQRVMIAMAIANNPALLIADEPTTALDVTIQAQILALLADLKGRLGMGIVFITHDLGLVRRIADRVYVMRHGAIVEEGEAGALFAAPRHDYTRMLIDAAPRGEKRPVPEDAPVLVEARDVTVAFPRHGGLLSRAKPMIAVDRVSLTLRRGQTLGLVGESGSGKSTLGRALLRLTPASGAVRFEDRQLAPLSRAQLRPLRRAMQLVFQDPFGSLSPRMTIGRIVTEGLLAHEPAIDKKERDRRAAEILAKVGIDPASRNRYPHEFSGGQRQRIAIARALILKPSFIVLDEPTSALDRSVQLDIIALLRQLQDEHGLTYLFISHDLAVVRAMADHIMVMKSGRAIETGPTGALFAAPREAYTRALIAAAFLEGVAPPQA